MTARRCSGSAQALAIVLLLAAGGCSVAHLSYAEIERDLDAIVLAEGQNEEQRLVYRYEVQQASWYARAWLLLPLKQLLLMAFGSVADVELENPSGRVRELLTVLAPKAEDDLLRGASAAHRLVRIAELDPSPLNRIVALDGLAVLADAHGFDLAAGLARGFAPLRPAEELSAWVLDFNRLHPGRRTPAGAPLEGQSADRYRGVLRALCAEPLPTWWDRMSLVGGLSTAWQHEQSPELRVLTLECLRRALRHAIQWTIVTALLGQERRWVDVRLRALEIVHRAGGPDSVPLLLALMANSPERIAANEPQFDPHPLVQLRLIHLCGQLDRERAVRRVQLPGREHWQPVAPVEFLARIALDRNTFRAPLALPARAALAYSLGRRSIGLLEDEEEDWVWSWYEEYRRGT